MYATIDGKAYMVCYGGEKQEERKAEYTLATGEFRWITNEDMDAWKWHSFYYDSNEVFSRVSEEPTDTVAKWGSRIEGGGVMDVGFMGFSFEEE
ncbi:MAG: hypothetical protein J1F02_08495 [Lachnospiraceae bacterium]|nr:hypothetical protein [Lachnospiraceae bacterium]